MESIEVAVVGAGQAGTATSHELSERGVEHVVLEAERPGFSWSRVGTASPSSRRTIPSGCPAAVTWATAHTATFRVPGSSNTSIRMPLGLLPRFAPVRAWTGSGPPKRVASSSTRPTVPSRLGRWSWRRALTAERISAALRAPAA